MAYYLKRHSRETPILDPIDDARGAAAILGLE